MAGLATASGPRRQACGCHRGPALARPAALAPAPVRRAAGGRRPRTTTIARSGSRDSGDASSSSSPIPDALPVAGVDTDWRAYRARLAAMEAAAAAGGPEAEAAAGKGGAAAATLAAGFRDSERWAHALPQPEPGCILLAHPSMFGSSQQYFNLAAILILECSESGALGIILNRPTQHRLGDVRFTSDALMEPFAGNRLYMGGDVGASSVIVLSKSAAVEDATEIAAGIRVVTLSAAAEAVASGRARPSDFRFFAQYAGWGPGQLQRECKAGVWFMAAVSSPLALNEELADGPALWHEILTTMGGPYTQVSQLVKEGRARLSRELQQGDEGSGA